MGKRLWNTGSRRALTALVTITLVGGLLGVSALAIAATLDTSKFEIDTVTNVGSNLAVNTTGNLDWRAVSTAANATSLAFQYRTDASGQLDNSFGSGTKEDTASPIVVAGGIPPNKSDLKEFFAFTERVGTKTYLNLGWSRIQDPQGTTNMDFELNQGSALQANGVPKRTDGDLLITYDLSNGGTRPTLGYRKWSGNANSGAWGTYTAFGTSVALGSINEALLAPVIAPNGAVYGPYSPRTFGEASIDLNAAGIFDPGSCASFGQAYLKSRSSDSFTAALKDYIAPVATNITNCGRAVVNKTDGTALLDGASFTISPANNATAPVSALTEISDGVFCIDQLLVGTTYTFHESVTPSGYDDADDQTFAPSTTGNCAGVTSSSTANMTFVNTPLTGSILIKKTKSDGSLLDTAGFGYRTNGSTDAYATVPGVDAGWFCVDGLAFDRYEVRETTVPNGYNRAPNQTVTVSTASTCAARTATDVTRSVDLTFVNNAAPGSVTITKTDDAASPNPLPNVEFKLYNDDGTTAGTYGGGNTVYDSDSTTDGVQALSCSTAGLTSTTPLPGTCTISTIPLGTYWVVETAAPSGHDGTAPQKIEVGLGGSANTGQSLTATFVNARQHKVIVLVCHEGTNTLLPSEVTLTGGGTTTTLPPGTLTADQQAALCGTGGASFSGQGHGAKTFTVTAGGH